MALNEQTIYFSNISPLDRCGQRITILKNVSIEATNTQLTWGKSNKAIQSDLHKKLLKVKRGNILHSAS